MTTLKQIEKAIKEVLLPTPKTKLKYKNKKTYKDRERPKVAIREKCLSGLSDLGI